MAVAECQLAALRAEFRRPEALRPVGREPASQSEPGSRRAPGLRHLGVRAAVSACRRERAWHRELVILPEAARRDVPAAVCRGGRPAVRRACSRVPALRSAQALSSVCVAPSGAEWLPAQARRGAPRALLSEQAVLP